MANGLMSATTTAAPKVATTEYKKPYKPGSIGKAEDAQKYGLGTAKNIIEGTTGKPGYYPEDISGKLKGPAQADYYQNTGFTPYQSLTGGDFAKLQESLSAPIMQQDRLAQERIGDVYGGRGLYGSVGGGLMSGAQAAQTGATQSALGQAYAQGLALQQQEAENIFKTGAMTTEQANQYAQAKQAYDLAQQQRQADFYNQQLAMQQQYGLDEQAWQNAQDQIAFDRSATLGGLGTSAAGLQAQQDIAKRNAAAAQQGALYQGIGSLAGGLMGAYGKDIASGVGDAVSSGYDWLSDLF